MTSREQRASEALAYLETEIEEIVFESEVWGFNDIIS